MLPTEHIFAIYEKWKENGGDPLIKRRLINRWRLAQTKDIMLAGEISHVLSQIDLENIPEANEEQILILAQGLGLWNPKS